MYLYIAGMVQTPDPETINMDSTAAFCLTLPGKRLYLSPLLAMKKFRKKGNKEGAIAAFYKLEEDGLGKVLEVQCSKGTSTVSTTM